MAEIAELTGRVVVDTSHWDRSMASMQRGAKQATTATAGMTRATTQASASIKQVSNSAALATSRFSAMQTSMAGVSNRVMLLTRAFTGLFAVDIAMRLASATREAIRATAELGHLATQAGLGAEQFQAMARAMRQVGIDQAQFAQASATLARNLSELQSGTGAFLQFLQESAPQLEQHFQSATSVGDAWFKLSEILAQLENPYDRIRLLQLAVGDAGSRMADVLARGPSAWRDNANEARNLGQVLDEYYLKRADELTQFFTDLGTTIRTQVNKTFIDLYDIAEKAIKLLNQYHPLLRGLRDIQKSLQFTPPPVSSPEVIARVKELNAEIEVTQRELEEAKVAGDNLRVNKLLGDLMAARAELQGLKAEFNLDAVPPAPERKPNKGTGGSAFTSRSGGGGISDLQRFAQEELQKMTDLLTGQQALIQDMILTPQQYADAWVKATASINSAFESQTERMIALQQLTEQVERARQQAFLDTVQMAGRALTQLFPKSKAAAIAEAVMNTAVGITKALATVPWPLNWVQAGLVAASGAAQIASIKSANLGGGGGMPRPGGGGGGGSGGSQAPAQPQRAMTIVIPPGNIFSSQMVKELVERINDEVSNGTTLISTRTSPT